MIEKTQQRIASFDAGVGTILFFEDQGRLPSLPRLPSHLAFFHADRTCCHLDPAPIQEGMEKYSSYAEQFPQWSEVRRRSFLSIDR
jgi:predicted oxidoreductase (fatty acid repression mutant protein)